MNTFVGRTIPLERLKNTLERKSQETEQNSQKVKILSIEGSGGIGKTSLFEHAYNKSDIDNQKYLILKVDGNETTNNLVSVISTLINNANAEAIASKPNGYFFPTVNKYLKIINDLKFKTIKESQKNEYNVNEEDVNEIINSTINTGNSLSELFPIMKDYIDFEKFGEKKEQLTKLFKDTKALKSNTFGFFEKLGLSSATALNNHIKSNACEALAKALVSDLSAILQGYEEKNKLKPSHKKIEGIDRLLLIFDDYENLESSIGLFLTKYLIPRLKNSKFESLIIVMGRDAIEATDESWNQNFQSLLEKIILEPLCKDEMYELVEHFDIRSENEKAAAWNDTKGYPFYVQLWIEETQKGNRNSALNLMRFYDRTTRWMTDEQKTWLNSVIFLDDVNMKTLSKILDNPNDAKKVFEWFKNEGSIRDTSAEAFTVRPFLRSRLLKYLELTDPELFEEKSLHINPEIKLNEEKI